MPELVSLQKDTHRMCASAKDNEDCRTNKCNGARLERGGGDRRETEGGGRLECGVRHKITFYHCNMTEDEVLG